MADYLGKYRTSYFKVKNEERLRTLISRLEGASLWEKGGMFAFGGVGSISELGDDSDKGLNVKELQSILPDGEVIIITEIGSENLQYLTAYSIIVTSKATKSLELDEFSLKSAQNMIGNTSKEIIMSY